MADIPISVAEQMREDARAALVEALRKVETTAAYTPTVATNRHLLSLIRDTARSALAAAGEAP